MRYPFNPVNLVKEQTKKHSNLPDRYIKRMMEQIYYKPPSGPQWNRHAMKQRTVFKFGMDRPWTQEFRTQNRPRENFVPDIVEPIKKWSFFIGDRVEVLTGNDKGKQGTIKQIIQERNWVIVEGLNTELELFGKLKDTPGVMIRKEKPLLVTEQVALVDPSDLSATSFKWQYTSEGENVRVSTRTGRIIPIPLTSEATVDYKFKTHYKDGPKDTHRDDVHKATFKPVLKTFEMDIMDKMGIKEDRIQKKSYWY